MRVSNMSDEPIFVAIGIACVVAVLLFIVFTVYCVKKQQEKEHERQMRQRRAREERHRRQLMRTAVVRPPEYDPNRQNVLSENLTVLPLSPPPEYKEVATPLPRHGNSSGYGDTIYTSYNGYNYQPGGIHSISGSMAPVTTVFVGNSHNTSNFNNGRLVINRSTMTTTRDGHISSNTARTPSQNSTGAADSEPGSQSSSAFSVSVDHSYDRHRQAHSVNGAQRNVHTSASNTGTMYSRAVSIQEVGESGYLRQQNTNVPVNTACSARPGESSVYSSSRNDRNHQNSSDNHDNNMDISGAGSGSRQTETPRLNVVQPNRSNISPRYGLSGHREDTPPTHTPRSLVNVNILAVTPAHISHVREEHVTNGSTWHNTQQGTQSGVEELSLI